MGQYRKIMLIADAQMRRTPALRRGIELARLSGAELHLCIFGHEPSIDLGALLNAEVGRLARKAYMEERRNWLAQECAALKKQGIAADFDVIWGAPLHETILGEVLLEQPDLVVKDARQEGLIKRLLVTPLDWHLVRICPAPLMLVRFESHLVPQRVVAAVDPTDAPGRPQELNDRIVRIALQVALQCNARLDLVNVFQNLPVEVTPSVTGAGIAEPALEAYEQLRVSRRRIFTAFADRYGVPEDRRHFVVGNPAAALADFSADHSADLLVLGSVYRKGVDRLLIGSTAEGVLDEINCDVLLLKPEGFIRDLEKLYDVEELQGRVRAALAA